MSVMLISEVLETKETQSPLSSVDNKLTGYVVSIFEIKVVHSS